MLIRYAAKKLVMPQYAIRCDIPTGTATRKYLRDINARDWNRCRILARGAHLQFVINGLLSSEFVDGAAEGPLKTGLLALQLHDDTTTVQFRDILLKRLR